MEIFDVIVRAQTEIINHIVVFSFRARYDTYLVSVLYENV